MSIPKKLVTGPSPADGALPVVFALVVVGGEEILDRAIRGGYWSDSDVPVVDIGDQ